MQNPIFTPSARPVHSNSPTMNYSLVNKKNQMQLEQRRSRNLNPPEIDEELLNSQ